MQPSPEVQKVLDRLDKVRKDGSGWSARCPCRDDDQNPSFHVGMGQGGKALVTCHRGNGCSFDEICSALELDPTELFPDDGEKPRKKGLELVEEYPYVDEDGEILFWKARYLDADGRKTFRQYRKQGAEKVWNLDGIPKVLYRLPAVREAVETGDIVAVLEGERDVDTAERLGFTATTMPGGAGKWLDLHTEALAGAKEVVIVADNDEPGLEHAKRVYEALAPVVGEVSVWRAPAPHKDLTDLVRAGGSWADLEPWDPGGYEDPLEAVLERLRGSEGPLERRVAKALRQIRAIEAPETDPGRLVHWVEFVGESADDAYDWVVPGLLERGDRVIIVAAEGQGKQLDLNEPILTTTGWSTIGELSVGDQVFDRFGKPCNVTALSPIDLAPEARWITFSTGEQIRACVDHLWLTVDYAERNRRGRPEDCRYWSHETRSTAEIEATVEARGGHAKNHAIAVAGAPEFPIADLPIDPYTLGVWLGDGNSRTNNVTLNAEDADAIIARIPYEVGVDRDRRDTCRKSTIHGISPALRAAGLYQNKHIPEAYLFASVEQRLALLQGLMDTDGTCSADGHGHGRGSGSARLALTFTNERLASDALTLIRGLGHLASMAGRPASYVKDGERKVTGTAYTITFQTDLPVFTVPRKAARLAPLRTQRSKLRYITAVEPAASVPMRCITVDSPDHSYLVGTGLIPTHNTILMRHMALCLGAGLHPFTRGAMRPVRTLMVDLENPDRIIRRTGRRILGGIQQATKTAPDAHLLIRPQGMNLLTAGDQAWLHDKIEQIQPDVVFVGPLYKSFIDPGGRTSEAVTTEVAMALDEIRTEFNVAMVFEHHAPLGDKYGREIRPFGSSVWSRWPEFGIGLAADPDTPGRSKVTHWRGARDERDWPTALRRSTGLFMIDAEFG